METLLREVAGPTIELVFERGSDVPELRGAPALIEQVVLNLVLNARDALEGRGRIVITTSTLPVARPDSTMPGGALRHSRRRRRRSRDGCGEARERAFDPFFSTKSAGSGTGLGLTTVREIATRHGGEVHIYDGQPGNDGDGDVADARCDRPHALTGNPRRLAAPRRLTAGVGSPTVDRCNPTSSSVANPSSRRSKAFWLQRRVSVRSPSCSRVRQVSERRRCGGQDLHWRRRGRTESSSRVPRARRRRCRSPGSRI